MRWTMIAIVMFCTPIAAQGQRPGDGGVSAPEVASALKEAGYPAVIGADRSGDPLVRSSTGKAAFDVYFYQCSAQRRCTSIQFITPYRRKGVTQTTIAAWHRDRRFGRAWLDNGIPWLSMDVETSRGVTTEALVANIDRWITVVTAFEVFAGR